MMTALDEKKLSQQIVVTTSAEKGDLWKIAQKNHFEVFAIPDAVGGRFSVLSAVGLLPSAFSGVNITELILGASSIAPLCEDTAPAKNPAYLSALVQYLLLTTRNKPIQVFFPYSSLLRSLGLWYAQLWAESLGKKRDRNGADVFAGQTPVVAVGTVDQHSQVQLYNEGPNDKSITFLEVEKYGSDVTIPRDYVSFPSTAYLGGRSLDKLIRAEKQATEYALVKHSRPNATFVMPELNARTLGQLFYLFEYQTAVAGELMNINAFDQPGVEDGKEATYALMGRPGYEDLHKAMEKRSSTPRCCV
jgi:glucose-6-phosphate isomerase